MIFQSIINRFKNSSASGNDIYNNKDLCFGSFKTILDIGAHHGNTIKKFREISPHAVIHAFEPFSTSFNILRTKYAADDKVKLNELAVSNSTGESSLHINAGDETNSLLKSAPVDKLIDSLTQNVDIIGVKTITLDEYIECEKIQAIDIIKIDTQGNTFEVLEGSKKALESKCAKWIYAETEFIEIYKNEKRFSEIELLLRPYGYHVVNFYNYNYTEDGLLAWTDTLFSFKK